jgi:hypothetical protein
VVSLSALCASFTILVILVSVSNSLTLLYLNTKRALHDLEQKKVVVVVGGGVVRG